MVVSKTKESEYDVTVKIMMSGDLHEKEVCIDKEFFEEHFKKRNTKTINNLTMESLNVVTAKTTEYIAEDTIFEMFKWWHRRLFEVDFLYNECYNKPLDISSPMKLDKLNTIGEEYKINFEKHFFDFINDYVIFKKALGGEDE